MVSIIEFIFINNKNFCIKDQPNLNRQVNLWTMHLVYLKGFERDIILVMNNIYVQFGPE